VKGHQLSSGKLGATGFCWGGGTTNWLAAQLGADLQAGVPFYGAAAETASVPNIKAPLLIHFAETDERINAMWPAYETALKAAGFDPSALALSFSEGQLRLCTVMPLPRVINPTTSSPGIGRQHFA